jgi:hypothetical protein
VSARERSDRWTRPARYLLPGTAERVRLIVSEVFGGSWDGFQRYICEPLEFGHHEYRFGGALGFGGKIHLAHGRLYVSCYREDETPIKRAAIRWVNHELDQALREMAVALDEATR